MCVLLFMYVMLQVVEVQWLHSCIILHQFRDTKRSGPTGTSYHATLKRKWIISLH